MSRRRGRIFADCKHTRRQQQIHAPLVSPRRWHFGYAFLILVSVHARIVTYIHCLHTRASCSPLASASQQLLVKSCDLAHHCLCCPYVCAYTHHSSLQHLRHRCLPSLNFSSQMEEQQNMRLPHGTTWWNHSYWVFSPQHYTLSNSYKLVKVPSSLCRHWPPHRSPVAQRPQDMCPVHKLHTVPSVHNFRRAPTRTATSDVMSATFAEFLERCNLLRAYPPRPQPNPTLLLDAAAQTVPHIAVSAEASTASASSLSGASTQKTLWGPRFHLRHMTLPARRVPTHPSATPKRGCARSVASTDATTQLPPTEFLIACVCSNDPSDCSVPPSALCNVDSASPPQPADIATLCSPNSTICASDCHACTTSLQSSTRAPPICATAASKSRELCPLVRLTWGTC